MRHLTILVDMDDTIENLAEAWVAYLNARHQTSTSLSDITDWDISKAFPTLTKEQVYAPLFEDTFWSWVKPMKGASETLQKLIADGHTVLIVTTSNYQTLAAKMEQVLFHYFPFLTWNDVIITAHKQLIKGDVLVDDGIHNLEGGDYFKILMTAPHNRNYDADKTECTVSARGVRLIPLFKHSPVQIPCQNGRMTPPLSLKKSCISN